MQTVSTDHLAEILVGIARAQAAVAQKDARVVQAIEAEVRSAPVATLAGLPLRLLLASVKSAGLDAQTVARELERLCGRDDARPTDYNP